MNHSFNRPEGCTCSNVRCQECGGKLPDHYWKCEEHGEEMVGNGEHECVENENDKNML